MSFLCIASADAQLRIGGRKIDTGKAVKAVGDMATAVTLSDEDIAALCRESVEWMDAHNRSIRASTMHGSNALPRV